MKSILFHLLPRNVQTVVDLLVQNHKHHRRHCKESVQRKEPSQVVGRTVLRNVQELLPRQLLVGQGAVFLVLLGDQFLPFVEPESFELDVVFDEGCISLKLLSASAPLKRVRVSILGRPTILARLTCMVCLG